MRLVFSLVSFLKNVVESVAIIDPIVAPLNIQLAVSQFSSRLAKDAHPTWNRPQISNHDLSQTKKNENDCVCRRSTWQHADPSGLSAEILVDWYWYLLQRRFTVSLVPIDYWLF